MSDMPERTHLAMGCGTSTTAPADGLFRSEFSRDEVFGRRDEIKAALMQLNRELARLDIGDPTVPGLSRAVEILRRCEADLYDDPPTAPAALHPDSLTRCELWRDRTLMQSHIVPEGMVLAHPDPRDPFYPPGYPEGYEWRFYNALGERVANPPG